MEWGMETRADLLDEKKIRRMHEVGLSNLNIGIETPDDEIAKLSKRKVIEKKHQENIVNLCKELGINVTAFFILAFENDTLESMEKIWGPYVIIFGTVDQRSGMRFLITGWPRPELGSAPAESRPAWMEKFEEIRRISEQFEGIPAGRQSRTL